MKDISLVELLEAGAHFGHQKTRWNPKMRSYIFATKNRLHILDLEQTKRKLKEAAEYVTGLAKAGKTIVFVATKRQAQDIVRAAAERAGIPFITRRWLGGTFTNFNTIKQRIKKLLDLEARRASGEFAEKLTKREQLDVDREIERLNETIGGIKTLTELPQAVFVLDPNADRIAVRESIRVGIPVVALLDTNANPDIIDYGIPCNDDAVRTIDLVTNYLADAIIEGKHAGLTAAEEEQKRVAAAKVAAEKIAAAAAVAAPREHTAAPVLAPEPTPATKSAAAAIPAPLEMH